MSSSERLVPRLKAMTRNKTRQLFRVIPSEDERHLKKQQVRSAYARWAPTYDLVFRIPLCWGRHAAVDMINAHHSGKVLEAGVGTGMSLGRYNDQLSITGIDLSDEMLARARRRASTLPNVDAIHQMDVQALDFEDNSFDVSVGMFLLPVVPDPQKTMTELARVTKPGGQVILVNHFSAARGPRAWAERTLAKASDVIGWDPLFERERVLETPGLTLEREACLPPARLFTLLSFRKKTP